MAVPTVFPPKPNTRDGRILGRSTPSKPFSYATNSPRSDQAPRRIDIRAQPETTRDPVSGREVRTADTGVSVEWSGVRYRFCSERCRARFVVTPLFPTKGIRIVDIEPILKIRRLRFVAPTAEMLHTACDVLLGMMGVRSATAVDKAIAEQYDLRQATLEQLEKTCTESGLVLRGGLHGWRRALWRFKEGNEIENAARPAGGACCNHPPARTH